MGDWGGRGDSGGRECGCRGLPLLKAYGRPGVWGGSGRGCLGREGKLRTGDESTRRTFNLFRLRSSDQALPWEPYQSRKLSVGDVSVGELLDVPGVPGPGRGPKARPVRGTTSLPSPRTISPRRSAGAQVPSGPRQVPYTR